MTQTALTTIEQTELDRHEHTISENLEGFQKVGHALAAIRDAKLYRESHRTFEAYCKERWSFTKSRANQLIHASTVVAQLTAAPSENGNNCCQIQPTNEAQVRELAKAEDPAAVWLKVVDTAPLDADGQPQITARHVAQAVVAEKDRNEPLVPSDCLDQPLPEKLRAAFTERKRLREVKNSILEIMRQVEQLKGENGWQFVHAQSVVAALNNAKEGLLRGEPYRICPYCSGSGCQACRQTGWTTKLNYDAAPPEKKVQIDQDRAPASVGRQG